MPVTIEMDAKWMRPSVPPSMRCICFDRSIGHLCSAISVLERPRQVLWPRMDCSAPVFAVIYFVPLFYFRGGNVIANELRQHRK